MSVSVPKPSPADRLGVHPARPRSRAHRFPRPARRDAARDPFPAGPCRSGPGRKAARPAGLTPGQFWSGPEPHATSASLPDTARAGRTSSRRKRAAHDSVVSLVLAIHAEADRPLGFDQVAELSGNRVTRAQVSTASSALCRDGQLDRIRSGVYQWSAGQRAAARRIPAARRPAEPLPQQALPPAEPTKPYSRQPGHMTAAELFSRLFPDGVQMTGERRCPTAFPQVRHRLCCSALVGATGFEPVAPRCKAE